MKSYELIDAAVNLIENTGWTQEAYARDANGRATHVHQQEGTLAAVCYCAYGALCQVAGKAGGGEGSSLADSAENAITALDKPDPIISYNDDKGRTKEEVLTRMRSTADTLRATNRETAP